MSDFNELNVGPRWYIIHTYNGYENKVKHTIEMILENRKDFADQIFEARVPVITRTEINAKGKEKIIEEKIYPAYVFVRMIMNDDTWHIVREITGVTGFVGPGSRPVPLTEQEVNEIFQEKTETVSAEERLKVGDEVEIIDGFLKGHSGKIGEIAESGEVTVIVSSIGREMPVSLDASVLKKKEQ